MTKLSKFALIIIPALLLQGCGLAILGGAAVGASMINDNRTAGAQVEDSNIELKAYSALDKYKDISTQSHINVTSYNSIVLVTGEAPSEALKQKVTPIIEKIEKVRKVYNELAIAAPSSMPSRSSDVWITSKIKAQMTSTEGVDPLNIKVVTERGTVYLMGLVPKKEADLAVNIVRNTDGVQRVVKIFETPIKK